MTAAIASAQNTRLNSLDILRGIAIFGMIFSSELPFGLPQWMYHDQFYNSVHQLVIIKGLTWVDIVYPFFLFSMGMAIPFALSKRLDKGEAMWKVAGHIVWRSLLLCGLAYYLGNTAPWLLKMPENTMMWVRTVLGFVCLILVLARLPFIPKEKTFLHTTIKMIGFAGILVLLYTLKKKDGSGFSTANYDSIMLTLSRVYLAVSLLWLMTRGNLPARLAVLAGIFALRLNAFADGPVLWTLNKGVAAIHLGWFYNFESLYVSAVAIFGSIFGDRIYQWTKEAKDAEQRAGISGVRLFGLLVGLPALTVGGLYFIQSRHVYAGLIFTAVLCCILYGLMAQTQTSMGRLMKGLFLWSTLIFILGYLVEPFGGGTSKTPATMSYHLLTSGMASSMLLFLMILLDDLKLKRGYGLLRVAGSNSLLAYIMGEHLVIPILYLMGLMYPIHKAIQNSVTLGTLWGAILTILILFVVAIFTRYKIYVRV